MGVKKKERIEVTLKAVHRKVQRPECLTPMTHLAMVFSREGLRAATSNDFDCDSLYAIKISLRFCFLYFRA